MEFRAIDPDSGRSEAAELQVLSGSDRRRLGRLASGEVCKDSRLQRRQEGREKEEDLSLTSEPFEATLVELMRHSDNQLRVVLAVEGRRAKHRAQGRDQVDQV